MGAVLGKDIPKMEELRRNEAMLIKNYEEVAANDAYNEALCQQHLEETAMPIKEDEAPHQMLQSFLLRLHKRL